MRFWRAVLSFSFLFISAESLKNHNKSQKNSKIENQILLDSLCVDLHSEHIIWYDLVQIFVVDLDLYFFAINVNNSYMQFSLSNCTEIFIVG